jgi:hypothetical protein
MTSDTDKLSVRQIYGATRDMAITWKLVVLCNKPPVYSQLDAACLRRSQYVPFTSTFVNEDEAPATEAAQYRTGRFVRRDLSARELQELSRRLMAMFYAAYCRHGMQSPRYALLTPRRIAMEAGQHLQELSVFRLYVRVFMRPSGMTKDSPMSIVAHRAAVAACNVIHEQYAHWLSLDDHRQYQYTPWFRLPPAAQDPHCMGSPGWVRCQCVYLMHFVRAQDPSLAHTPLKASALSDPWEREELVMPYIGATYVADHFNRYRRRQNVYLNRQMSNHMNTLPSERADGVAAAAAAAQEAAEEAADAAGGGRRAGGGSPYVTLSTRMRLESHLVQECMREIIEGEPDGDRFIGRVFLSPDRKITHDNNCQNALLMDRVLAYACRSWWRRFRAPLAYPALFTRKMKTHCTTAVMQRSHAPRVVPDAARNVDPVLIEDDWEKAKCPAASVILSDEETGPDYFPEERTMWDPSGAAFKRSKRSGVVPGKQQRDINAYRARPCWLFPTSNPPPSVIVVPSQSAGQLCDPVEWNSPRNASEAEALMTVENFWESVELRNEIERNRITRFEAGFAEVGRYPAMDNKTTATAPSPVDESSLSFYLGPDTRLVVSAPAGTRSAP